MHTFSPFRVEMSGTIAAPYLTDTEPAPHGPVFWRMERESNPQGPSPGSSVFKTAAVANRLVHPWSCQSLRVDAGCRGQAPTLPHIGCGAIDSAPPHQMAPALPVIRQQAAVNDTLSPRT